MTKQGSRISRDPCQTIAFADQTLPVRQPSAYASRATLE
jgi:hypothetical protein